MKATITSPPPVAPPPVEITITMSERDARILTAFIGLQNKQNWDEYLQDYVEDVKGILPSDFNIKKDLPHNVGNEFYIAMIKAFDTIKQ